METEIVSFNYTTKHWFLAAFCVAAGLAVFLTLDRGKLIIDRQSVSFGRADAIVYSNFSTSKFRRDVFDYLDRVVPKHGFVTEDLQIVERATSSGQAFHEIHFTQYRVRRLKLLEGSVIDDHSDSRAARLNSAMIAAIEHALEQIPDRYAGVEEILRHPTLSPMP